MLLTKALGSVTESVNGPQGFDLKLASTVESKATIETKPVAQAGDDTPGNGFGPLRTALEQACAEERCSLSLTVLAKDNDPFRLDTPANHRDAQWVAEQIERAFGPHKSVHPRGLHYAIVAAGNVRKPNGDTYINSAGDDAWLALCLKAARWLGYVPFERISDNRNSDPIFHRGSGNVERPSGSIETYAFAGTIEPPSVYFRSPEADSRISAVHNPTRSRSSARNRLWKTYCCRLPGATRPICISARARRPTRSCTGWRRTAPQMVAR